MTMQQPAYPPYQPVPVQPAQQTDGLATASMVLGICQIIPFVGLICAILALIFGWISMRRTKNNPAVRGHGQAVAGFVLGVVGVGIATLIMVLIIIAAAAGSGGSGG